MTLSLAEKKKRLDSLSAGFNKKQSENLIGRISVNEEIQKKLQVDFIETPSININAALGKGIPKGKITLVAGNEDSGKTGLMLETIAKNQKENPDFVAGWLESENSISIDTLLQFGIDLDRIFWIPVTKKGGGAEEALNLTESAIASGTLDMFVINSLKCLVPSEEMNKGIENVQVGLQARMNSKMMRKLTSIVAENNVAFVMIQHLTTNIGTMSRDPLIIAGGKSIRYGASIIIDMRKKTMKDTDPIKKEEGLKIGVSVKKNHVITNRYPYVKTEYYVVFGKGIEVYIEAIEAAIEQGLITKSGAFIKLLDEEGNIKLDEDGNKMQWQGIAKFRTYCIENPDFFNNLLSKLKGKIENLDTTELDTDKDKTLEDAELEEAELMQNITIPEKED